MRNYNNSKDIKQKKPGFAGLGMWFCKNGISQRKFSNVISSLQISIKKNPSAASRISMG